MERFTTPVEIDKDIFFPIPEIGLTEFSKTQVKYINGTAYGDWIHYSECLRQGAAKGDMLCINLLYYWAEKAIEDRAKNPKN